MLWDDSKRHIHWIDNFIMQDLSIEGRCMLSGAFMMLCRVCMAIVLLIAIGFTLDEVDIEYAARALAIFVEVLSNNSYGSGISLIWLMVLPEVVALPVLVIAAWGLLQSIYNILLFTLNIVLGVTILMLVLLSYLWNLIYNVWWYVAATAHNLIAYIWSGVCIPFQVVIHVIKYFGLLSLTTTHLVLHILYYIFLLWVFTYLLMLLYRFITRRDWAIQLEFYIGPTPEMITFDKMEGH